MLIHCSILYALLCTQLQHYSVGNLTLKASPDLLGRFTGIRYWEVVGLDAEYSNKVTLRFFRLEDEVSFMRYRLDANIKDAGVCQAYSNKYQAFYYYSPIKLHRS